MSDQDDIARAHRAKRELTETEAAFDKVREVLVNKLLSTAIDQQALREKLFFAAQTVDAVKRALVDVVQNGEIAEVALAKTDLLRP